MTELEVLQLILQAVDGLESGEGQTVFDATDVRTDLQTLTQQIDEQSIHYRNIEYLLNLQLWLNCVVISAVLIAIFVKFLMSIWKWVVNKTL